MKDTASHTPLPMTPSEAPYTTMTTQAQSIETLPEDGEFLAFNGPRQKWMQVYRYEPLPGSNLNQYVVEPYSGLMFVPKWWAPLPALRLSEESKQ